MIDGGKRNVLGVLVDAVHYEAATGKVLAAAREHRPLALTALAVHGVMTGVQDKAHGARLNAFDVVTPDGQPVRWALNLLHGASLADRVYGPTLTLRVLSVCADEALPVYLYGSTQDTLDRLVPALTARFPALKVAGAEPSKFRSALPGEPAEIAARIKESGARLVLVGLGCPRQEVFAYAMRPLVDAPLLAVGAPLAGAHLRSRGASAPQAPSSFLASLVCPDGARRCAGLDQRAEAGAGRLVAQGAGEARRVGLLRAHPERRRYLVLPAEVGAEHRRIVGVDGARDPGRPQRRQRMGVQCGHHTGAQVRGRAHVQHQAAVDDLGEQRRVLRLSRVRDRGQTAVAGDGKGFGVLRDRARPFNATQPEPHDAALPVADRHARALLRELDRDPAVQVGREPYRDAVLLRGGDRTVGVPLEDLLPADATLHPFAGREDALDVDGAERRRLGRVVDHDTPEVLGGSQAVRGEDPDLDEVPEVGELVEPGQPFHRVRRQGLAVTAGDLQQRGGPDRPFQVQVQLNPWGHRPRRYGAAHRGSGGPPPCFRRLSGRTAAGSVSRYRRRSRAPWSRRPRAGCVPALG